MITLKETTLIFIAAFMLLAAVFTPAPAQAQTLPKGFTVSWQANPAKDGVEWYILEVQVGEASALNSDDWSLVTQTSSLSFSSAVTQLPMTVALGDSLCFRVTAAKGTIRSSPSNATCEVASIGSKPPSPDPSLSTPVISSVTFSD